jgi:hypothetical protein
MKKFTVLFFLLVMISCFKPGQSYKGGIRGIEPIDIDGIVSFEFLNQWGDYFYKKTTFTEYNKSVFYDWGYLSSIGEHCGLDTLSAIAKNRFKNPKNDLGNYSQVQNQNKETDTANYYCGGDLYYTNANEDIAIAFRLKGKGLKFNRICKTYLQQERYRGTDCPEIDKEDEFSLPFISLVEIDTIFSLSQEDREEFNLTICPTKWRVPKNVGQCYERREEVCNIVLLKHKLCSLQNTPLFKLFLLVNWYWHRKTMEVLQR